MLELESFKSFIVLQAQQFHSFSLIPLSLFEQYSNKPNKTNFVDKERKHQQYSLSMVLITIKTPHFLLNPLLILPHQSYHSQLPLIDRHYAFQKKYHRSALTKPPTINQTPIPPFPTFLIFLPFPTCASSPPPQPTASAAESSLPLSSPASPAATNVSTTASATTASASASLSPTSRG